MHAQTVTVTKLQNTKKKVHVICFKYFKFEIGVWPSGYSPVANDQRLFIANCLRFFFFFNLRRKS